MAAFLVTFIMVFFPVSKSSFYHHFTDHDNFTVMIIYTKLRLVLIYNVHFSTFKQETRDKISARSGFVE